jgi:hypothetical protein
MKNVTEYLSFKLTGSGISFFRRRLAYLYSRKGGVKFGCRYFFFNLSEKDKEEITKIAIDLAATMPNFHIMNFWFSNVFK